MAEIIPFRALRYDAARHPIAQLVTQPYDKITPAMQERYYQTSPYNLVRIILGKPQPGDDGGNNVYSRAASFFQEWQRQKILLRDPEPSMYVYVQRFAAPGSREMMERMGLIALGRIHDYSEGVIFRHEQTLSQPKADRLQLLRATGAQFGQLFMLYSDPAGELDGRLRIPGPPEVTLTDEYGVEHSLWRRCDPAWIERVQKTMAKHKLLIADGHHRYETAMAYRDECRRAESAGSPAQSPRDYDYAMMTFINMDRPELLILPTHRVVYGLSRFDETRLFSLAAKYFSLETLAPNSSPQDLLAHLQDAGRNQTALLAVTQNHARLLRAIPESIQSALAEGSDRQRKLDVVQLHRFLLQGTLAMSEESIQQQKNITYLRDAAEAIAAVRSGQAQVAFLMNAVRIDQLREVGFAGEIMPQKSTDFYPKLLSGLTIYALQ